MMLRGWGLFVGAVIWLAPFAWVAHVSAQDGFALSRYRAAPSSTDGFGIMLPAPPPHLTLDARLALDYAHGPLVVSSVTGDTRTRVGAVVDHTLAADVAVSFGIGNWLGLWVALPITLYQAGDDPVVTGVAGLSSAQALGDMELGVRALVYGERQAPADGVAPSLGLSVSLLFPTGSEAALTGDGSFGVRGQLVGALLHSLVTPIVGLGVSYRPERAYLSTSIGPELTWLLGLHLREDIVRVEAELRGGTTLSNGQAFSGDSVPLEVLLGGRLMLGSFTVGLAVDAGLTQALGTPDVRVIGTFGFAAPLGADGSSNRDGDGDHDDDDEDDRVDDDGHSVPNVAHRCLNQAGAEGCPAADADGDGVLDGDDFCPEQAEVRNGYLDDDGCPDGVEFDGDIMRPSEAVLFSRRSANLSAEAKAVLRLVSEALGAHDEITLVQVEGHAARDEGNEARTLSLSEQRAEAVLTWLSSHGVDASRLTFAGMGGDVPVEGAEDEAVNRRVTFRVLERR